MSIVAGERPGEDRTPPAASQLKIFPWFAPGAVTALGLAAAVIGFGLLAMYLSWYQTDFIFVVIGAIVGMPFFLALWAGVWAIGNRVFSGRFNFWPHLTIASLTTLAIFLGGTMSSYASFAMPGWFTDWVIGLPLTTAPAIIGLLAHIDVSSERSPRFKSAVTGGVTALLVALVVLSNSALPSSQTVTASLGALQPLPSGLIVKQSSEEFAEELEGLEEDIAPEGAESGFGSPPPPP